jgi:endonuclease/exonuclease/phosphatase family metal-dependent hydrolase
MKKGFLILLGVLISFITWFFFWGSSATLPANEYNEIKANSNQIETPLQDTYSLVTYNLGYLSGMTNNKSVDRSADLFQTNLNKTVALFNDIQPDFIAFQEIDFNAHRSFKLNQMDEITTQNSYNYSAKAVNWDKQYVPFPYWPISQQFGLINSGQAILSEYEIIKNDIITLQKPEKNPFYYNAFYLDRLAQVSIIDLGKQQLVVINVHLEAFHPDTRNQQIKTVLGIFHKYSEKFPVILCGDFNSTPPGASNPYQNDNVIKTILADYQIEMAINMQANEANESDYYTFNSETPDRRIDYFFYNPKFIEVLDARVLTEAKQISDHLPVWFKFKFRR